LSGNPLTGAGYFWQDSPTKKSLNYGKELVDKWVVHDPAANTILYNLTAFDVSDEDYNKNKNSLKGYYMTCGDHQPRVVYLKLRPRSPEASFGMGNTRLKINIRKDSKYSVAKHAEYSDVASLDMLMYHLSGKSYADGDMIGDPTGGSIFQRCFTPANMTWDPNWTGPAGEFTAPPTTTGGSVTGRWTVSGPGPLSSDQMMFVSLMEGFKPSDAFADTGFQPFKNPPDFQVDFINPVNESVATTGVFSKKMRYKNVGDHPLVLTFESVLEDKNPADQDWFWDFDAVDSTGTASAGTSQYTLDGGQHVTVDYTMTPGSTTNQGDLITARHQINVDYLGIDPGIFTYDVDFNIMLT
jgi:hypothetical protein